MLLFIKTLFLNIFNNNDEIEDLEIDNLVITNNHILQYYQRIFSLYNIKYFNNDIQLDDINIDKFTVIYNEYLDYKSKEDDTHSAPIYLLSYYNHKKLNSYINFIKFHKISILFSIVYTIVNMIIFIITFRSFYIMNNSMDNIKIYKAIAKGSAQVILFNSFVIVLPFLSYIYKIIKYIYIPYHLGKILHYIAFSLITVFSITHTICHFILISKVYELKNQCVYDALQLNKLHLSRNFESYFTLRPYYTGILLLLILIIFILSFIIFYKKIIRFNIFYSIHIILIYSYFGILIIHGSLSWLKTTQAWVWCAPILLLLLFDKRNKVFYLSKIKIAIVKLALNRYIKLTIPKTKMLTKEFIDPSMTLDICIPAISKIEWHKFTITTAPGDDNIVLYIQIVGQWTAALQRLYLNSNDDLVNNITLFIDRPKYNTMKYVQLYKRIYLICTGFGITPFISFIRHVIYNQFKYSKLEHINIIWVINDSHDFYMFNKTLSTLIHFPMFNLQIYFTNNIRSSKHREAILILQDHLFKQNGFDIIAGMHQKNKTILNKPNFKFIFQDIIYNNKEEKKLGMFICGNIRLQTEILNKCRKYSNNTFGLQLNYFNVQ